MSKLKSSILGLRLKWASHALNRTIQEKLREGVVQAPKYIKEEIIAKKVSEANNWYTKALGLDEVKNYQQRVIILQEKLLQTQERRREIGYRLGEVRKKSNELQDQLQKVKRQDDLQRFYNLMKEETEILKQEMEISNQFNVCDREEREIFTAYTNAVKDSHEKQRAQIEYTKYFGIILSILGSFLTFCYSAIRKRDLKNYIDERLGPNDIVTVLPTINKVYEEEVTNAIRSILQKNVNVLPTINKVYEEEVTNAMRLLIQNEMRKTVPPAQTLSPVQTVSPAHQEKRLEFGILGNVLMGLGGYILLKLIIG